MSAPSCADGSLPRPICWANELIHDTGVVSLRELFEQSERALSRIGSMGPIAIVGEEPIGLISAAVWLAATGRDGMIAARERLTPPIRERLATCGFGAVDIDRGQLETSGTAETRPGRVCVLTSGTTGEPKIIAHSWTTLFTMGRVRGFSPTRWILPYQPGTYAWFQLVTLLLFVPGQSVITTADRSPAGWIRAAARSGATAVSATPTFWRLALLEAGSDNLQRLELRRVTLGGEAADQAILDQIRVLYPVARIAHIYASTEAGASVVVQDGREGFPAAWLDDDSRTPELKLRDGKLWIRSPHAGDGVRDWIDTQDLAEVRADRVLLLGRATSSWINVGGAKAFAGDIERVLTEHASVLWCRARAIRAPIVGNLVAAEIVLRPHSTAGHLAERELAAHCAERLPPHMVPRVFEFRRDIPVAPNFKSAV